jgi:hypothetical protein
MGEREEKMLRERKKLKEDYGRKIGTKKNE